MTPSANKGGKIAILVVDDNPADLDLTRETFRDVESSAEIFTAHDGVEALCFLHRAPPYLHAPRPDLILLDLNMPRMDGRELLHSIKQDPVLRRIPVVVLTTSRADSDVRTTYDLHANCFVTKPIDYEQFTATVKSIESFWLRLVQLADG